MSHSSLALRNLFLFVTLNACGFALHATDIVMPHPDAVHGCALSADSKWAATGCADHMLRL